MTSARYRFEDAFNLTLHKQGELPIVATVHDALTLIGAAGATDLHVIMTFHITMNANGEVAVTLDDVHHRCG